MEKLNLTQEWDKVFPKSDKVDHKKVTFHNRYGITLAADMYTPKGTEGKLPAIAVSGPFGAVKEQSSGLYAQKMAELGFLTIAFDPSYTGESGGMPRYVASPDINTEDFCAAVDFLSVQENVDPERIGIIGICGWGGMAINAAAIDTPQLSGFSLYHRTFQKSRTFLIFCELFMKFVRCWTGSSVRSELIYSSTASSVCQEVFSSFFKIFMTRIRNARHSQKRSAIISNRIAFVKHYFRLFSTFFVIYHKWYKQR